MDKESTLIFDYNLHFGKTILFLAELAEMKGGARHMKTAPPQYYLPGDMRGKEEPYFVAVPFFTTGFIAD